MPEPSLPQHSIRQFDNGVLREVDNPRMPENAVALAINVNFDRIPLAQRRPGLTQLGDAVGGTSTSLAVSPNADPESSSVDGRVGRSIAGSDIGLIEWFAGGDTDIPSGYLMCDGSAVSRTTYSLLFAVISTRYGSGDGSTTFNLPNLIDRFVQGIETSSTNPSTTGGADGVTTGGSSCGSNNAHDDPGSADTCASHTHSISDQRPKFLDLVPVIAF